MIGLALIRETVALLESEIEQKEQEKKALLSVDAELSPFLTKIKDLCARIPEHADKILAIVASELDLQSKLGIISEQPKTTKSSPKKKPCPFKIGDWVRVITSGYETPIGTEFEVTEINPRGLGWQIINEKICYRSGDLELVEKLARAEEETDDNAEGTDTQSQEEQAEKKPTAATDTGPKKKLAEVTEQDGFKIGDLVSNSYRGSGIGKVSGFVKHEVGTQIKVKWEYGNDGIYWSGNLKKVKKEEPAAATKPQEEQTEEADNTEEGTAAQSQEEQTEESDIPQEEADTESQEEQTEESDIPQEEADTESQEEQTEEADNTEEGTAAQSQEEQTEESDIPQEEADTKSQEEQTEETDNAGTQEEQTEGTDTQSLISKAIAALKKALWKPNYVDFKEDQLRTLNATPDDKSIALIFDGNTTKGWIEIWDGKFKTSSLDHITFFEDINNTLSEIAPLWEKQSQPQMVNGLNLGRGIRKDFQSLDHENLMTGNLRLNNYSKSEWENFARLIEIEPKGTRKQIANAICETYQKAYNESKFSSPVAFDKNERASQITAIAKRVGKR